MKKCCVRLIGGLLAVCLALSVLPAPALAGGTGSFLYTQRVAPRFQAVGSFSEGLVAAKEGGKWGYVDADGQTAVPFQYDLAYPFCEGKAIVGTFSTRSTVNRAGASVDSPVCLYGFVDHSGAYTAFQMPDPSGNGQMVPAFTYRNTAGRDSDTTLVFQNGLVQLPSPAPVNYVHTSTGGILQTGLIPAGPMNSGLAPGYDRVKGGVCGYYDRNGKVVLSWGRQDWVYFGQGNKSYRYISAVLPFDQELAPVWQTTYDAKTGRESSLLGLIDTSGKWVVQPAYSACRPVDTPQWELWSNGLAVFQKDNQYYGAIDKTGRVVIPFQYNDLQPFQEGLARFQSGSLYGYLNPDGSVAIPAQYSRATSFQNGYAAVQKDGVSLLIDRNGTPLTPPAGLEASVPLVSPVDKEGFFALQFNGAYGFGELRFSPALPREGAVDGWALSETCAAIEADLVPASLQNRYRDPITRQEFCTLVMTLLCETKGCDRAELVQNETEKSLYDWMGTYPFKDSTHPDVIAAYALGIVTGRGDKIFDPNQSITRQEAAAFLTRTARRMGMDVFSTTPANFVDSAQVGSWFQNAVNFVAQVGIMGSVGDQRFQPLGTYTKEQSFMTVHRLYRAAIPSLPGGSGGEGPLESPDPTATPAVPPVETPVPTGTPVTPPVETPVPTGTPVTPPDETPVPTATPVTPPVETPVPTGTPVTPPIETAVPTQTPAPTVDPVVSPAATPSPPPVAFPAPAAAF